MIQRRLQYFIWDTGENKTKQNTKADKNNLTTTALSNPLFFCFEQHPTILYHISVVHLEKLMNNQDQKMRDIIHQGLTYIILSGNHKWFSTSLYSLQILSA